MDSRSKVWEDFEKIMSEKGLSKTADKKDADYNVVPSDMEETGYDLIEQAYPEQVQVANSRLNDGIVENANEMQKAMVEVALRNPRGVLAELTQTLVKIANELDEDQNDASIKMASEIDTILLKLSQEAPKVQTVGDPEQSSWSGTVGGGVGAAAAAGATALYLSSPVGWAAGAGALLYGLIDRAQKSVGDIYDAFEKTGDFLAKLDFGWYGFRSQGQKAMEAKVNEIAKQLQQYGALSSQFDDEKQAPQLLKATFDAINYVNAHRNYINKALGQTSDIGYDAKNATAMWNKMSEMANAWLKQMDSELVKNKLVADPKTQQQGENISSKTQPAGGHAKAPMHFPAMGDNVKKLQALLGFTGKDVDGKFGPHTWQAVVNEANVNQNKFLQEMLHTNPTYADDYKSWNPAAVDHAVMQLEKSKPQEDTAAKTPAQPAKQPYETEPHFLNNGLMVPYENEK